MIELTILDTLRLFYEVAFELFGVLRLLYDLFTYSPHMTIGLVLLIAAVALSIIRGLIRIAMYVALIGSIGLFIVGLVSFLL